jgi:hypothetical protein
MMGKKPEIPWDAEIGVSNEAPVGFRVYGLGLGV